MATKVSFILKLILIKIEYFRYPLIKRDIYLVIQLRIQNMYRFLLVIFLVISIVLIILIMLQQIKGADVKTSSSVGSTIFSFKTYNKFVTSITFILATLVFVLSLILGNISNKYSKKINGTDLNNVQYKKVNQLKNCKHD
ncbi:Protein-export membrane protein SecG [Candidatus Mikella endobia]|uniref:Protein-export membrane protein SecG n=2 Tax=Candidatus Mikella endobia TaxID=1778264 RepID=A0A143WRY7_9ENTR|nr:Protein-export membrane protein SecG [Candidatus Mikella endobia]